MSFLETERRKRPLPLDDPIYRPRTISKQTGLNYHYVLEQIRAGKLGPVVELGPRAIGVRASGVEAWLQAKKRTGAEAQPDTSTRPAGGGA
jgi:hypothetical protein